MKKNKSIIKILIILLVTLFFGANSSHAYEEKATIKTSIQNVSNPVTNSFTYKIEPTGDNITPSFNQPKEITIEFNNQEPNSNEVSL